MAIEQIDHLSDEQIKDLLRLYKITYWAKDRKEEDVRRMLSHSTFLIGMRDSRTDRLVAFARVVTDQVYKALLLDVVVDPEYQGTGLGKRLMDIAMEHPIVSRIEHVDLFCTKDMIPFYERWGFVFQEGETKWMRRERKME